MVFSLTIPKTNENVDEVTLGRWHRLLGDAVSAGDLLVEVITDKATFEMESPGPGLLRQILFPEKSVVPVGAIIGFVAEADEALPNASTHNEALMSGSKKELDSLVDRSLPDSLKKVRATPSARRMAREMLIDLDEVARVLGVDRRLTEEDVEAYLGRQKGGP